MENAESLPYSSPECSSYSPRVYLIHLIQKIIIDIQISRTMPYQIIVPLLLQRLAGRQKVFHLIHIILHRLHQTILYRFDQNLTAYRKNSQISKRALQRSMRQ